MYVQNVLTIRMMPRKRLLYYTILGCNDITITLHCHYISFRDSNSAKAPVGLVKKT